MSTRIMGVHPDARTGSRPSGAGGKCDWLERRDWWKRRACGSSALLVATSSLLVVGLWAPCASAQPVNPDASRSEGETPDAAGDDAPKEIKPEEGRAPEAQPTPERGAAEAPAGDEKASATDAEEPAAAEAPAVAEESAVEAVPAEGAPASAEAASEVEEEPRPPDAIPGSPRPPGLSLHPEAPPTPPAPGGRAPSFGAPAPEGDWAFALTGRISAWESVGVAERPHPAPAGYKGPALHLPAYVTGKQPFWAGAGLTLNFVYGTPRVSANVSMYASLNGIERRGYTMPSVGPDIAVAYLAFSPKPIGRWQLRAKVGAFRENFGGPGQWGWGIFGPMLAVKGYGESLSASYPLSRKTELSLAQGLMVVPSVPEAFVRGDATGWAENARSTWVHHEHVGISYQNQYVLRFHYGSAQGTDERTYLADDPDTDAVELDRAADGHMNVYVVEARATKDPYGQFGLSAGFWDFKNGFAVHDGIWWGLDWTAGGREMVNKFLGADSNGNGQVGAISAEYGLSIARVLWYPRAFDGRAPDIRVKVAGILHDTFASDDVRYEGELGYMLGTEVEYQMLRWLSATMRVYGENRFAPLGRFWDYSVSPGLIFKGDWQSGDRIELAYTRMFYSDVVDVNAVAPFDRNLVTLGAIVSF